MRAMRAASGRLPCALLAGVAILLAMAPGARAAYPPGSFPGPGPGGAFRTVVASQVVCIQGATLRAVRGAVTLTLGVPAGSFGSCTQVTIYGGTEAILTAALPTDSVLVDAFAVSWEPAGETRVPLTITLAGPVIDGGVSVFETTGSGLTRVADASVRDGSVSIVLTTARGLVLASPAPAGGVAGITGRPKVSAAPANPAGPQDASVPGAAVIVVLVLLAIAVSTVVIAVRLRYGRASSRR